MKKTLSLLTLSMLCNTTWASAALQQKLENLGATNVVISDSPLPQFKTAVTDQGVLHISEDGRFIIQGKVFELKDRKAVDISQHILLEELESLRDQMIVYPAKNPKHTITVFMDISCHYCHLLHSKMKEYNELGISVRYLAFPRGGVNTNTAKQMEAIWSAKDPVFALNEAEQGRLPKELKEPEKIKKHYQLGLKFGVNGTPNIITEAGEVIPGYIEPKELLSMLNE